MLGNFTTDPLEKQFEKSGSHGTYFTSVQQFLEISWCSWNQTVLKARQGDQGSREFEIKIFPQKMRFLPIV